MLYCLFAVLLIFNTPGLFIEKADPVLPLHYLLRNPKIKTEKPPVLILLHGYGSNEKDLFSFASQLPDQYLIVSARAPIHLNGDAYAWYPIDFSSDKPEHNLQLEESSRNTLLRFITELKEKFKLNTSEIYLCGFSQGAIMALSLALTRPDIIKGSAVMSGRLLKGIKSLIAKKENLRSLKIFISHGINDNTLPISYGRESHVFVKSLGIVPIYKEYQEGHSINNQMLKDLIAWLK